MKLVRYGAAGCEKPGILDADGRILDLSDVVPDLSGRALLPDSLARVRERMRTAPPLGKIDAGVRLGPCVGGVGKFICVGLNYSDHAAESGMAVPVDPILFMKATSAICGPNDDVVIPRGSQKTDWEVELGVVIGKPARYATEADAPAHIAGYCVVNDLSERAFQLEGTGQWVKGKSADTFGPIGPWLVTPDEVPDPQNLTLWLEVDGRPYQRSSTRHMIFSVARLVSFISHFMSLHPGDVISTGTPPGIGMAQRPPVYLRPGNRIRLGIEGLGEQRQLVVADAGGP